MAIVTAIVMACKIATRGGIMNVVVAMETLQMSTIEVTKTATPKVTLLVSMLADAYILALTPVNPGILWV
jgi:hypothetical protein